MRPSRFCDRKVTMKQLDIKKDDELNVLIEDLGSDGEGIGHVDGYALFVKDALIGDMVRVKVMKAKKNYGYARLMELITPSPYRIEPACPCARQCGGCQLQHCSYDRQLEYKQNKVKNCLERIGKFTQMEQYMEPIMGMEEPFFYRNKAQFPVGIDKTGNLVTGFYAGRTHSIIDESCSIQAKVNQQVLHKVKEFLVENHIKPYEEETQKGLIRHILTRVGFEREKLWYA